MLFRCVRAVDGATCNGVSGAAAESCTSTADDLTP
jgi:hypothetical protein